MNREAQNLYTDMGATPVINALGPRTFLGGSTPAPEVLAAMELAGRYYVDMDLLLASSGRLVAALIKAEAALITPGCAAALLLGTAACMTGAERDQMEQLPDTTGLRNEVVIQRAQRYKYDRVIRQTGAVLVEVGSDQGTTVEELADALGPRTAAVLYPAIDNNAAVLSVETTIATAHDKGVPVIVDAAFRVYPVDDFSKYTAMGADLVGYGAKYFGAPNSSGILCGRQDLVEAAHLHSFACFETRELPGIGRPLKIDRQEVIGVVVALQRWLQMDHSAREQEALDRASTVEDLLSDITGIKANANGSATVTITVEEELEKNCAAIEAALRAGSPSVWVDGSADYIRLHMDTVHDGDEAVLAASIRSIVHGTK